MSGDVGSPHHVMILSSSFRLFVVATFNIIMFFLELLLHCLFPTFVAKIDCWDTLHFGVWLSENFDSVDLYLARLSAAYLLKPTQ